MRQFASGADTLIAIKQFHTPGETTLAKSAPSRKASAKTAEGEEIFALRSLQDAHDANPRFAASDDELLHFYEQMLLIRRFEEKAGQLYGSRADRRVLPPLHRPGSGRCRASSRR
jgi:hypothetical protein